MNNSTTRSTRVAVVGAGIAGSSAAFALLNAGYDVQLFEQAAEIREVGAGVGIRATTAKHLRRWGVWEEFASRSAFSPHIQIRGARNELFVRERWPQLTDDPGEERARFIHRADLLDIFMSRIGPDRVHTRHRLASLEQGGDGARLEFENGHVAEFDLIVGADGIRSVVRDCVFGPTPTVYSGFHAYRAIVNDPEAFELAPDNALRILVADGIQIYLVPLHHRNQVSFDVTAISDDPAWQPDVSNGAISEMLDGFDERVRKIAAGVDHYVKRSIHDIEPLRTWHNDSVVLVGDAAHAMCHHQGYGANSAIQDAGVLDESLRTGSLPDALEVYESLRKPLTDRYQALSRIIPTMQSGTIFHNVPEWAVRDEAVLAGVTQ
ncbi:FAD-dependent oxidoreductase [Microbacterium pseudoresistens]|uniref:Salicylate hydroxylase n=1 Tax=Microbacterium pseudoresistens TaxID=640634 RepID=A0A7Y9EUC6_9MICO|nr:FAD-dependent monooxygenase [Microbacterium pseudoresistens]NYD53941.1 salicylate hydroxylase [Microbacterium pseudoresistens]